MSVQTQIDRIKANIASAYTKAAEKGAEIPEVRNSGNLPAAIESIPSGGLPEGLHTITVETNDPEGGHASGGGTASRGMTVTVTAEPENAYRFSQWSENGYTVSQDSEYTFPVSGDRRLTAVFTDTRGSRLPEGYTELKYIQLGPSLTSTVNTKLGNAKSDQVVDIDFEALSWGKSNYGPDKDQTVLYNYNVESNTQIARIVLWLRATGLRIGTASYGDSKSTLLWSSDNPLPARCKVHLDLLNKVVSCNGGTSYPYSGVPGNQMWCIGPTLTPTGSTQGWREASVRIYGCKFSSASTTSVSYNRNYIPAKRLSDGYIGLFDLTSNTYFLRVNGAAAGPEV